MMGFASKLPGCLHHSQRSVRSSSGMSSNSSSARGLASAAYRSNGIVLFWREQKGLAGAGGRGSAFRCRQASAVLLPAPAEVA